MLCLLGECWALFTAFQDHLAGTSGSCRSNRQTMEELVDEGAARAIGVSNFSERLLGRLCSAARIKPVVNQVELHPLLSQRRLVGACARKVRAHAEHSHELFDSTMQPGVQGLGVLQLMRQHGGPPCERSCGLRYLLRNRNKL
jgi:predicted oxidoreductase